MNEITTGKGQGAGMNSEQHKRLGRRDFLRRGAVVGAVAGAGTVAGGTLMANAVSGRSGAALAQLPLSDSVDYATIPSFRIMATDGWASYPGRRHADGAPVYGFGFRSVDDLALSGAGGEADLNPGDLIDKYKGKVLFTAPTIIGMEGVEMAIVVTNLGLVARPDLDDAHSLHWHGYRNATAVFDGVPETSISVPSGRDLPYFFDNKLASEPGQVKGSAGTYMYHCHFEDTEHVEMGMTGIIFVEPWDMWFDGPEQDIRLIPSIDWPWKAVRRKVAYNDNPAGIDSSFDREFALLMGEIDTTPHDNLEGVQEFVWSDYDPNYWMINGRSYPDTVIPQITPAEQVTDPGGNTVYGETMQMPISPAAGDETSESEMLYQHNSSLIQCREGDQVLLRMANLGYEVHSIEAAGLDMRVIAHDASMLIGKDGTSDLTYTTRRIELGPGEARDVLFNAPAYDDGTAVSDTVANRNGHLRKFNRYIMKSRNNHRNSNDGFTDGSDGPTYAGAGDSYGGMVTEVWVYPTLTDAATLNQDGLPDQISINETFPTLVVPAGHV